MTDYLPEIKSIDDALFPAIEELDNMLGDISVETINIPHDCTDGFMCAYWKRPEQYLIPEVRKAISTFSRLNDVDAKLSKLKSDIKSGEWHKRYSHLLGQDSLDLGYRLVILEY